MEQTFKDWHWLDSGQNPAGGCSTGTGFTISWQNGPLGRGSDRIEPNGAFVETLIRAVMRRLEFYQSSKFICDDNATAISYLDMALSALQRRTRNREVREVEGTHKV